MDKLNLLKLIDQIIKCAESMEIQSRRPKLFEAYTVLKL